MKTEGRLYKSQKPKKLLEKDAAERGSIYPLESTPGRLSGDG
jgi:hypothetical protein